MHVDEQHAPKIIIIMPITSYAKTFDFACSRVFRLTKNTNELGKINPGIIIS